MKKTAAVLILALLFSLTAGCAAPGVVTDDPDGSVPASSAPSEEPDAAPVSPLPGPASDTDTFDTPQPIAADGEPEASAPSEDESEPPADEPTEPVSEQPPADEPEPSSAPAPVETPPPAETEPPAPAPVETPPPAETEPPVPETTEAPVPPVASPEETLQPAPENGDAEPAAVTVAFNGIDESSSAVLQATEDMGQDYIDRIVFLGDSTTYGMKYYRMLSDGRDTKQVWTPTSGTLTLSYQSFADIWYPDDGTEIPIRDAAQKKQPEYMIITLGVNGVSFMDEDYFKSEYADLVTGIQQASPDTKIILQSIFPVASNYEYQGSINNEKINKANQWVLDVAESTGVRYLNTCTVLIGSDGYMVSSYQNGDGLHLNETGFGLVLDYIRTHAYP
jgi:outer membrane biosynthesis protein TonB